jgi:methionine sulfoxide reductase heme-binding subunit
MSVRTPPMPQVDPSAPVVQPRPIPETLPAPDSSGVEPVQEGRSVQGMTESALWSLFTLCVVMALSMLVGTLFAERNASLLHNKMLPWILGRGLGIACYLALTAMVVLGIWLRHPWRTRTWSPRLEALLRAHVTLAACTITLLAGHLTAIALDHYAGVGWIGTFVPWHATYRPTAVALGTLALYALVLIAATAALAGSIGRKIWFPIHTVSATVFGLTLVHGLLSGSDGHALRWMYVVTGAVVVAVQVSRWTARYGSARPVLDLE